jgi:hypothetical protein
MRTEEPEQAPVAGEISGRPGRTWSAANP